MHALEILSRLFHYFNTKGLLPTNFPTEFLLKTLGLIMTHNVFQFGPSYWLQTLGTAMGTPVACTWAILYYGYLELMTLLTKYNTEIILFTRLIDDKFVIWNGSKEKYIEFQHDCNNFGVLRWDLSSLKTKVNFLDLTVTINQGYITTKTYEKPHNLYLYIPFTSSHSSYCKKSIIWSLCYRYFMLNDSNDDYINQVIKLYNRITRRGYPPSNTKQIIVEATQFLERKTKQISSKNSNKKSLEDSTFIFKTTFSNSFDKDHIKKLIKKHLTFTTEPESNFNFKRNIIAFKKDKNLQEILSPSKISVPQKLLHMFNSTT